MRGGAIEDYTFLWWDVRPHPKLGTVETRVCDQQTSLGGTMALAALIASLARRLSVLYDNEEPLVEYPSELIDDNKVRAALRGMEGMLVDFRAGHHGAGARAGQAAAGGAGRRRDRAGLRRAPRNRLGDPAGGHGRAPPAGGDGELRGDIRDVVRGLLL